MAVYEKSYRPYEGALTAPRWRFLVLPRYAYREVFASRLFTALFALAFVPVLVLASAIYLRYNLSALKALQIQVDTLLVIDARFFRSVVMVPQALFSFLVALIIGPALVSPDLRNNALPLYLSRPFSKAEYVLGKISVLLILLSLVTWLPGLGLFALQSYLAGQGWGLDHAWIAGGLVASFAVWILLLSLASLALSAWVKWKPLARILFLAGWPMLAALGGIINQLYGTVWGTLLSPISLCFELWDRLLRQPSGPALPAWGLWTALAVVCGLCLLLLARRVRAYEVVS
jgi:ABC-2 type transport system permease protein